MDDEKNMEILTTYQIYLVKQMDVIFSACVMAGLMSTNDLRMRANMKDLETKYKFNYQQFLSSLEAIVSPETQGDMAGAKAAAESETAKDNGEIKATTDQGAVPESGKDKTKPAKKK